MKTKKEKEKYMCLTKYSDLVWCLYNDFRRSFILFDDANNLDLFTEVENLWNKRESQKV